MSNFSGSRRPSATGEEGSTLSRGGSQDHGLDVDIALRLFSGALDIDDLPEGLDLLEDIPEDKEALHPAITESLHDLQLGSGMAVSAPRPAGTRPASTGPQSQLASGASTPGGRSGTMSVDLDSELGTSPAAASSMGRRMRRLSSAKDDKAATGWALASVYLRKSWQYQVTKRAAAAAVLSDFEVEHILSGGPEGIREFAKSVMVKDKLEDTFYIYDLGNVTRMFRAWKHAMPRVTPYYAVKCNPEPAILKLLMALGAGFDCASKSELHTVLAIGVPQSRIIFAHPCKRSTDIQFAALHGVEHTTFDTISELDKIAAGNPKFKCVLRIRADDPDARIKLGLKYGANPEDASKLLEHAKMLKLQVVGVSFHVGSGCQNLDTFTMAIQTAREVFDLAELMGFHMELLDIGGGFTGHFDTSGNVIFGEIASTINAAIDEEFPAETGVRIMAEPGRYFAETSATLFTPVYGWRDRDDAETHSTKKDYWITDGLYGSFNCIIYDGQTPEYQVLRSPLLPEVDDLPLFKSTIWGPTCDSADCVYKDVMLPQLRNNDWLSFPNAGAYTVAGACDFNGIQMTKPTVYYVFSDHAVDVAADAHSQHSDDGEEEEEEAALQRPTAPLSPAVKAASAAVAAAFTAGHAGIVVSSGGSGDQA